MEIEIFANNPFQENTIILYDETGYAALIDCGCFTKEEKDRLFVFLKSKSLKPTMLLCTHLHTDHVLGCKYVKDTYGVPIYAASKDEFLIENAVSSAQSWGLEGVEQPPMPTKNIKEGDVLRFGDSELTVIEIPGHTPGGLCFYSKENKILISGDSLFCESIGRTDLAGGDYNALISSLKEKILTLPDDVKVYPGHGPSTTIGHEKKYNQFLKD